MHYSALGKPVVYILHFSVFSFFVGCDYHLRHGRNTDLNDKILAIFAELLISFGE